LSIIVQAVLIGMLVVIAGTIPRNLIFAANLRYYATVPWAVPLTAVYLWLFWRYLNGDGPPTSSAEERRMSLRANRVSCLA
jgi:membrane protein implicated in regulation of membrane protease activity